VLTGGGAVRGGAGRGARQRRRHGMEDAVARGQAGGGGSSGWHGVDRSGWRRWGREGEQREVERAGGQAMGGRAGRRDAQGRASDAGSVGWAGRMGAHLARLVGWIVRSR
jgi:hypothetical protein